MALEATGNSDAIANLLTPRVGRVVVSNPVGAESFIRADRAPFRAGLLVPEMILSWVPTTPLPDDHPAVRMAAPVTA